MNINTLNSNTQAQATANTQNQQQKKVHHHHHRQGGEEQNTQATQQTGNAATPVNNTAGTGATLDFKA